VQVDEEEVGQKIQGQVKDLNDAGLNVSFEEHGNEVRAGLLRGIGDRVCGTSRGRSRARR
jgi:hypothetical protein